MSIAEKITPISEKVTTIAENVDKISRSGYKTGYENGYADGEAAGGGGENILQYVSGDGSVEKMYYRADFDGRDELKIYIPNCPSSLSEMFALSTGLRKLIFSVPPENSYNGYRFMYGGSGSVIEIEELELPDGIKFSNFTNFARNAPLLKIISGRINLSECTVVTNCFQNCTSLEYISFMPETIPISISFANSPNLSADSIDSIVNGLARVSGQTLTVHPNVAAKITETDVTGNGWTLAY